MKPVLSVSTFLICFLVTSFVQAGPVVEKDQNEIEFSESDSESRILNPISESKTSELQSLLDLEPASASGPTDNDTESDNALNSISPSRDVVDPVMSNTTDAEIKETIIFINSEPMQAPAPSESKPPVPEPDPEPSKLQKENVTTTGPEMDFETLTSQPPFDLTHFLEKDSEPIVVKPTFRHEKSPLDDIKDRTCIPCLTSQASSSGRYGLHNEMGRFEDFVPEAFEYADVNLDSNELLRRKRNFQRITNLLPEHRSLPTLEQFLYEDKPKQQLVQAPAKKSERFLSKWFSFWPFVSKTEEKPSMPVLAVEPPVMILKPDPPKIITLNHEEPKPELKPQLPQQVPSPYPTPTPFFSPTEMSFDVDPVGNTVDGGHQEMMQPHLQATSIAIPILYNEEPNTNQMLNAFENQNQNQNGDSFFGSAAAADSTPSAQFPPGVEPRHKFRSSLPFPPAMLDSEHEPMAMAMSKVTTTGTGLLLNGPQAERSNANPPVQMAPAQLRSCPFLNRKK